MPSFEWQFILLGAIGGLIPDIVRLTKNWDTIPATVTLWEIAFYQSLFLLAFPGGFAAWLFAAATAKEAVGIGIAAPTLLSQLGAEEAHYFLADGQGRMWRRLQAWWAM